ncbi:MAG TPA: polysaccharide deacetylase family protein [Polyangiaceae bacterium]|nr:polysaccharide deacetylase family protein [Polyangiaceae bacterium]
MTEGEPNPTLNPPPPTDMGGETNPEMMPPPPAMDPQDPPVQNPPPAAGTPVRCDNLALAPNRTGVAQPSGAVGGLRVLDWAGFRGAASFTFDDNTPSQMDNYAQLKATGGRFTWFVVGNFLGNNAGEIARFRATQADGMEVANHTFSHQSAGSVADLMQNQNYINTNFGVNANSMAAPNCAAAWATVAPNVLFQNRGPCGAPINTIGAGAADRTSPFAIPAYLPAANEAAATMSAALVDGQWRVYVIHGFDNRNGTFQPIPIANVTGAISTAVSRGFWVEGMTNIGAYWQGQKLISAAATTSATWTKPARFPANMCLRITTTGGTVTQRGQVIPWDDHGYYQIGLDAGEVTIQ